MIKVTMLLPDRHGLNLQKMMAVAVDFRKENVTNPPGASKVVDHGSYMDLIPPDTLVVKVGDSKPKTKLNGNIKRHRVPGTTAQQTILDKGKGLDKFSSSVVAGWLHDAGYADTTATTTINRMLREGYLRSTDEEPNIFRIGSKYRNRGEKKFYRRTSKTKRVAKAV